MRPSQQLMRCLCRPSASAARPTWTQASRRIPQPSPQTFRARPQLALPSTFIRHDHTSSTPEAPKASPKPQTTTTPPPSRLERDDIPAYELTFTCKACDTRSSHRISKQGYHKGTVLITCPGCKNRHLISDHLKIFSDKSVTIEDLMREKGQLVRRGSLSAEGDVEFWEDGSTTPRSAHFIPGTSVGGEGRLTKPADAAESDGKGPVKEEGGEVAKDQFEKEQDDKS